MIRLPLSRQITGLEDSLLAVAIGLQAEGELGNVKLHLELGD